MLAFKRSLLIHLASASYSLGADLIYNILSPIVACLLVATETCLPLLCLATATSSFFQYSGLQPSCHNTFAWHDEMQFKTLVVFKEFRIWDILSRCVYAQFTFIRIFTAYVLKIHININVTQFSLVGLVQSKLLFYPEHGGCTLLRNVGKDTQTIRSHTPDGRNLNSHSRETLNTHISMSPCNLLRLKAQVPA
jgi:hypothetical protein